MGPKLKSEHAQVTCVRHRLQVRMGYGLESDGVGFHVVFTEADQGALVAHLVAIVRRREHRNELSIMLHEKALLADFVGANNEVEVVILKKALRDIRSKGETHATLGWSTTVERLWVTPENIRGNTSFRGFTTTRDLANLIELDTVVLEETAMHNENLLLNAVSIRQGSEALGEELHDVVVVLFGDFALKAIHLVHVHGFMVTTVDKDAIRVQNLVCKSGEGSLKAPRTTIAEVAVPQVRPLRRRFIVNLEDVEKIVELSMGVSQDTHVHALLVRNFDVDQRWELYQQVA
mmetsp:Transcript_7018/g.14065  ORF Transcript_7018/g.14065 Transcript_7018/m.14065 type:complete len:290 (+) Transcript_7018:477-1346(+)